MRTMTTILIGALLCAAPALADTDVPSITVTGTAITEVAPDEMNWRLRVHNEGPALADVAAEHHRLVGEVLNLLADAGIDEKEMQTTRMTFGENRVFRQGTHYKEGYTASTNVSFTSKDLDGYAKLFIALAGYENLSVENVSYDVSNRIELQHETRREALDAARTKAGDLAGVLGATLGEPLHVIEQGAMMPRPPMMANRAMADESMGGGGPAHSPGQITISMSIQAVFRLITVGE